MTFLSPIANHVHWGLRLSVAATFLYHGLGKWPPAAFAESFDMPLLLVWAIIIAEVIAGLALIIGAFGKEMLTRLGGLIVIIIMIGAIALVHAKNGWNVMNGGMEFQVLLMAAGLYFAARGNNA